MSDSDPTPRAGSEELLNAGEIQGNILAGFNKDHQAFLFLRMEREEAALSAVRAWLRELAPQVSSLAEVNAFNTLFRAMRARLRQDPPGLSATWVNVALSASALSALTSADDVAKFADQRFRDGLATWSGELGDPTDPASEGHPSRWVVGGPHNEADILLIVASDSRTALWDRVAQLKAGFGEGAPGSPFQLVWEQIGETLPRPLTGHEHFGFKDGISLPGVRGLVGSGPDAYLTPRLLDPEKVPQDDPTLPEMSRPGQPLVWPGQFVFGYLRQDPNNVRVAQERMMSCPEWARNGSYLVLRRLRQDVGAFRGFVHAEAARLATSPAFPDMTAARLAAQLVGRWPSGAPILRAPRYDDEALGGDELANNYFRYTDATEPAPPLRRDVMYAGDHFPAGVKDDAGRVCPFSAHIRKMNPRDVITEQGSASDTLRRLVLRRGIPFGPPYEESEGAEADTAKGERGLVFVCYQTSIANQFMFLQKNWANDTRHPNDGGGHDALIGQSAESAGRRRSFDLTTEDGAKEVLALDREWVIPTGGGFFFSPSISTIADVLGREPPLESR